MKVTLSAAMRARDVSRPRPEQLAEAAAGEQPPTAEPVPAAAAAEDSPQPRTRRRRRRLR